MKIVQNRQGSLRRAWYKCDCCSGIVAEDRVAYFQYRLVLGCRCFYGDCDATTFSEHRGFTDLSSILFEQGQYRVAF